VAPSGELYALKAGVVCLQVKLRDPHLSALEVGFSRRDAIKIYVYLYLQLLSDISFQRLNKYRQNFDMSCVSLSRSILKIIVRLFHYAAFTRDTKLLPHHPGTWRYGDLIFLQIWLEIPILAPKFVFLENLDLKTWLVIIETPKGTSAPETTCNEH